MIRRNTTDQYVPPVPSFNYEIRDERKKQEAVQYSLNLIQGSLKHLQGDGEKISDDELNALHHLAEMKAISSASADVKMTCSNEMIKELIKDHERLMVQLSDRLGSSYERFRDNRIANMIRHVIEEHRSVAWTLKRFLVA
jgi:DNA-binding ferritin-like protein